MAPPDRLRTVTREGLTLDVRDTGPVDGPPVLLLHGFPQDGTAYDDVAPLLAAAGHRVLVPDQRGYSPGARPAELRAYVLRRLVDDVVAVLDAAGVERAHVVGHDWGGTVAWAVASRRAPRVSALTVLSTPHPAAMRDALWRGQARRSAYILGFQLPRRPERRLLADDGARLRQMLGGSGLDAAHADRYVRRMSEPALPGGPGRMTWGALTAALAWYRALRVRDGFGAGRVRVPTTFLHGTADPFFAPAAVEATGRYVVGPYRSVALDAGHWLPETRADDVAAAVLATPSADASA
ncbi:alpha/beta fold hydrolase [Actinotalea sp. Marseille-Q4924]|uniref:alpha/beta fold hydrolase n=1 Tax=Actinotalea sp. Marseille-Q4924 TaxID=2866571 RepID=UPI001CE433B0|nr:alpha/beta fold hydrolase [Actinotalea sp. Marseille-Q4924]